MCVTCEVGRSGAPSASVAEAMGVAEQVGGEIGRLARGTGREGS